MDVYPKPVSNVVLIDQSKTFPANLSPASGDLTPRVEALESAQSADDTKNTTQDTKLADNEKWGLW